VAPEQPTATATLTPIDIVLGERPPGPPSSGSGLGAPGGDNTLLLAVLGLIAMAAGLASLGIAVAPGDDD
jgi:hypothetical protein